VVPATSEPFELIGVLDERWTAPAIDDEVVSWPGTATMTL
jgi:hypothetical protein